MQRRRTPTNGVCGGGVNALLCQNASVGWRLLVEEPRLLNSPIRRIAHLAVSLLTLLTLTGCLSAPAGSGFGAGARWPDAAELADAARSAATDPLTWVPVAAAAAVAVTGVDDDWTEDAIENAPLFGDDAAGVSDDIRDGLGGLYVVTALIAPSDNAGSKLRGLGVGLASFVVESGITEGLKEAVGRDRPNGKNDRSFPSGHSVNSAARAALIARNLDAMDMPHWTRRSLQGAAYTTAALGSYARVEASKHHVSDVLVGYALGNFVARFMTEAFLGSSSNGQVALQPLDGGGAITLTLPLR